MKVNCIKLACMTCLLFFMACTDSGTADNGNGDTTNAGRSGMDTRGEDFVSDVLEMNAEEMAWLREAMNNATDAELKSTAQEMMKDHEKMEAELKAYASSKNFRIDDIDTSETVKLNEKAGRDWDEEWADEVGDKHRQMIRRFERAERRTEDTELKGFISRNLPSMRTHLAMVDKLEARLDENALNPNENVSPVVK